MTEKRESGAPVPVKSNPSQFLQDERLATMLSSYLDGELAGAELEAFEALLRGNNALAKEVADLRQIEVELKNLGSDILLEPIPSSLLDALSNVPEDTSSR